MLSRVFKFEKFYRNRISWVERYVTLDWEIQCTVRPVEPQSRRDIITGEKHIHKTISQKRLLPHGRVRVLNIVIVDKMCVPKYCRVSNQILLNNGLLKFDRL